MTDLEIQEVDRKKRFLRRYKKNKALIDRLKKKIINIDVRSKSLRSPKMSDMPRGGTPVSYDDLIAEKDELQQRVDRLEEKGKMLKAEILEKIDELEDTRYAEILESFFIECKSFNVIAEENDYTERHVIRLYSEAIKIMSI